MDRNIQIEPLLQELDQQKALFDRFCLTEMKRLQALSANCENMTEETKSEQKKVVLCFCWVFVFVFFFLKKVFFF